MESLGAYLRALREERKVSLPDLLRETRIPRHVAEALEEDRYEALPAPVFTRGFIRAYLSHLGLPADEAVAFYQAKVEPPPAHPRPTGPASSVKRRYLPVAVCLTSAVVFSLALYVYVAVTRPSAAPPTAEPISARALPAEPPATVEAPKEELLAPVRGLAETASLRLVARVIEPTWVRVEADEGRTIQELLPASAVREWSAQSRFVLTVGNAGGVKLELNGKPLPPLGRSGEVIRNLVLPERAMDVKAATSEAHQ